MSARPRAWRFAVFYAALFAVVGFQLPYWPVWLKGRGLGAAEIGVLVAAQMWVKVGFNPLVGGLVDRTGRRRPILLGLAVGSLLATLAFPFVEGFWALLALSLTLGALFAAIMPVGDNLTMRHVVAHGLDYGRLRMWGSLAFIGMAGLAGGLLDLLGRDAIVWLLAGALAPLCLAVLALPDAPPLDPLPDRPRPGWADLLRDRRYGLFLAATACVAASHAMYYGFGTLHWQRAGIGNAWIGALWGIGVIAEVALFAWSGGLVRRLGPVRLIVLGAAGGVVRWGLMPWIADPWLLVPLQCLHGLTFGATHLGAMHFIARRIAPTLSGRAQSIHAAVGGGVSIGLATLASGWLYGGFGGRGFLAMAALAAAGALAALRLARAR